MEAQWIVIICAIAIIIVFTCCRLCFLFLKNRETDKTFENPSKTKTSSKSSIHSNGSIKSLIKNPNKAEAIHDWLTDTPQKLVNSEDVEPKNEEKLRGGTKEFAPIKSNQRNESKVDVDSDESENEALLFETTEKESNNKYENIDDLTQLQSTMEGTENEATSPEDKKMLLKIMNNEVEELPGDKDLEANHDKTCSMQEVTNTKFEVMRTMTHESNIHTSDTLPLNMAMSNINELMKTSNGNEDSIFSSSILKKDSMQETTFEVNECSAVSSNVQIIEQKSSSTQVSSSRKETKTVFQQSSSLEQTEFAGNIVSETDL